VKEENKVRVILFSSFALPTSPFRRSSCFALPLKRDAALDHIRRMIFPAALREARSAIASATRSIGYRAATTGFRRPEL
jgi:hypothetical protein